MEMVYSSRRDAEPKQLEDTERKKRSGKMPYPTRNRTRDPLRSGQLLYH